MKKLLIIIAVAAIAAVILLVGVLGREDNNSSDNNTANTNSSNTNTEPEADTETGSVTEDEGEPAPESVTIVYSDSGFDGQDFEVAVDGTVTVQNNSNDTLEFSSDSHPTHTINPELNLDPIEPGQSREFQVSTKGKWGFHNHLMSNHAGELTVR